MRKSNLEKLSKKEKNKYDELESRYKPRCNKYLKLEPDAVIKELRRFIKSCGHYPRSRKPEQLEQGALYSWDDECRLAKAIKTYLEEGKFDSTQTKFIEEKRALLKPSGSTSYSEKLLLHALENALKDIDILVRSNIKLCGVEVDVVLETNNGRIGIQYDGGAHNYSGTPADDVQKTEELLECLDVSKIIRVREACLPDLELGHEERLEIVKIEQSFSELSPTERERCMSRVLAACGIDLYVSSISWDEIEPIAHRASSTGAKIAHLIGDAVVHLLIEGDDAGQGDDFVKIVKRLRKYKGSGSLLEEHVDILGPQRRGLLLT